MSFTLAQTNTSNDYRVGCGETEWAESSACKEMCELNTIKCVRWWKCIGYSQSMATVLIHSWIYRIFTITLYMCVRSCVCV